MSRLPITHAFGDQILEKYPEVYRALNDMYIQIALAINEKSRVYVAEDDPPASDEVNRNFQIGDMWINKTTPEIFIMSARTSDIAVTWTSV